MDRLESMQIKDRYGTIYGVEPPSRNEISSTLNELIDKLEEAQYKSGYLISKFGKPKL